MKTSLLNLAQIEQTPIYIQSKIQQHHSNRLNRKTIKELQTASLKYRLLIRETTETNKNILIQ